MAESVKKMSGSGPLLALAAVAVVLGSVRPSAESPGPLRPVATHSSPRIPAAAQGAISAALGNDAPAYHARAAKIGFTFTNSQQRLEADLTPAGVRIRSGATTWSFRYEGLNRGTSRTTATMMAPTATANRVEYRRGPITEWYVNGPFGLEQGFTLAARPQPRGRGPLVLRLSVSSDLQGRVDADKRAVTLAERTGHDALTYRELVAWDARGRPLPASLRFDRSVLSIEVDDTGAAYPVTIDPLIQPLAKLTPTDYDPGADNFGNSIAIEGDTIVVGGPKIDVPSGVYVFTKPAGGWAGTLTQVAKLTASDLPGFEDDTFAGSVAISGDTIVTGALYSTVNGATAQGAAYVFVKPATGWVDMTETAKLLASNGQERDFLGCSVAIDGDTIVAGAYNKADQNGTPAGGVYVFVKPPNGWASVPQMTETARLAASDGSGYGNALGYAVGIGNDTIVASAPYDGLVHDGRQAGAAYVFLKPAAGWTGVQGPAAKLAPPGGTISSFPSFGNQLAIDRRTGGAIVVSDYTVRPSNVFLFVRPVTGWTTNPPATLGPTTILTRSDGSEFSFSVAVDGDRVATGVVSGTAPGAVYVYDKPVGGWPASMTETLTLVAPDTTVNDSFGTSVAVRDQTIAVGERGPLVNNVLVPVVHVFGSPGSGDTTPPDVQCSGGAVGWIATNVTVACTASDSGSGLADPADASFSLSTNIAGGTETSNALTGTHQVCDVAGNCAPTSGPFGPFMVDLKPPTITIVTPTNFGAFTVAEPVASDYSCNDGGSGVATCAGDVPDGVSISTKTVGTKIFTVNATDNVGNAAPTASNTYLVGYGVNTMGTRKTVSLRLVDFTGVNMSSTSIAVTVTSIDGVRVAGEVFTFKATGGGSYKYTPPSGLSRGAHTLTFQATGDPVSHAVNFTK